MVYRILLFIIIIGTLSSCAPQYLDYSVSRVYSFILGQKSLNSNEEMLSMFPGQTLIVGTKLIIADPYYHRVLIWNDKDSASRAAPADVVIGQPNLGEWYANNGGLSDKSLYSPSGVASDGTMLFIGDTNNNRILVFNTIPSSNFASADYVLGQTDFTSNGANHGVPAVPSSSSLYYPRSLHYAGGKLFAADG